MDRQSDEIKNNDSLYVKLGMMLAIGSMICVIILGLRINSIQDNALNAVSLSEKALADEQATTFAQSDIDSRLDNVESRLNLTSKAFLGVRETMFDLWLDSLNDTAKGRVGNFELLHQDYFGCLANKELKGITIVRNLWYDHSPLPAKAVIVEYDNHYLTYKKNGIIQCFPNPLLEYNTSAEPCENFCGGVA